MSGHLIHVGFAKAGSTSLQRWFADHPQLAVSPDGIIRHALAGDVPRWYVTSSEGFTAPGATTDGVHEPVAATVPVAELRGRTVAILRALSPAATILIVTRGFRGALLSSYSEYVKFGGTVPLGAAFSGYASELADFLDYDATVAAYRAAFAEKRVIVLPYELLRDDPVGFVARLEARLGLDAAAPPLRALNRSLSPAELHWLPRLSARLAPLAGVRGFRRVHRRYVRGIGAGRSGALVRPLARLAPGRRVDADDLPGPVLDALRGRATSLAALPEYAAYRADYLNERDGA